MLARIARHIGTRSVDTTAATVPVVSGPHLPARRASSGDPRSLDSVYRALFILETAARQLTVDVWRQGKQLLEEQQPAAIRRPSLEMSRSAFIAETVNSLAQRGNAFWRIYRQAYEIYEVRILNPLEVLAYRDTNSGQIKYTHQGRQVRSSDIIHMKLTHQPGEVMGLGPIQACSATLRGAMDMRSYADNWTAAPGRPTGILSTDQNLTRDQAQQWKEAANSALTPENGVGVFGSGLKYQALLLNPEELQFLENQQANVTAIARMFGIPARLILTTVEGGAQTYANMQQEDISFLRYTLMAYLREIEEALTQLAPRGQVVRFNLEGLLRTDTKTRYESHAIGLSNGFLTVDEVRSIEGLPPQADLEIPLPEEEAQPNGD